MVARQVDWLLAVCVLLLFDVLLQVSNEQCAIPSHIETRPGTCMWASNLLSSTRGPHVCAVYMYMYEALSVGVLWT